MIVDIQTRRLRTIGQLRAFVEGNEAVDFQPRDRAEAYGFARSTLERFGYRKLGKRDKRVALHFWSRRRASRASRWSGWCGSGGTQARSGTVAAAIAAGRSRASTRRRISGCWRRSTRRSARSAAQRALGELVAARDALVGRQLKNRLAQIGRQADQGVGRRDREGGGGRRGASAEERGADVDPRHRPGGRGRPARRHAGVRARRRQGRREPDRRRALDARVRPVEGPCLHPRRPRQTTAAALHGRRPPSRRRAATRTWPASTPICASAASRRRSP